jgi:hypothetical protein
LPLFKQDSVEPPKYQSGAVAQVKTVAHPSPSLKPNRLDKAKRRLGEGAVNESQTFSKPYNNFNYEPNANVRKPTVSSKMETYETKENQY